MDFDINTYLKLLTAIKNKGYSFQTFQEFIKEPMERTVVLRHDVDLKPLNSLAFARIQAAKGIKGTFYFRAVKESWDDDIIKEIHSLGHEIGYHYECLTTSNGNLEHAMLDFKENLKELRKIAPVQTICMHGSPLSKYDSKDLWKSFDYKDLELIAEPYFDVDFYKTLYLTDTGRTWNNKKYSVRDHIKTDYEFQFTSTKQIINAIEHDELPHQIMFTFHPQRWTNNKFSWLKEFILQNVKNQIKRFLVK